LIGKLKELVVIDSESENKHVVERFTPKTNGATCTDINSACNCNWFRDLVSIWRENCVPPVQHTCVRDISKV